MRVDSGSEIVSLQDLIILAETSTPVAFLELDFPMKVFMLSVVIGLKSNGVTFCNLALIARILE